MSILIAPKEVEIDLVGHPVLVTSVETTEAGEEPDGVPEIRTALVEAASREDGVIGFLVTLRGTTKQLDALANAILFRTPREA